MENSPQQYFEGKIKGTLHKGKPGPELIVLLSSETGPVIVRKPASSEGNYIPLLAREVRVFYRHIRCRSLLSYRNGKGRKNIT